MGTEKVDDFQKSFLISNLETLLNNGILHSRSQHHRTLCLELDLTLLRSKTALAHANLGHLSIYPTKLDCLIVGKLVHRAQGHVDAGVCMIDSQHEDRLALVGYLIACPTLCAIPSTDINATSDVGEARNLSLCVPAVSLMKQLASRSWPVRRDAYW